MTTISAQTILRSRNGEHVLSTLLLRYPRFIHAELMTHRAFSRNAASSRAIPVAKLIEDVRTNPAIPLFWGKNRPGMQAKEECAERLFLPSYPPSVSRKDAWLAARDQAIAIAQAFADAGYHKQIVNRLLEPFAHITVLVSATEWDNFLELRDHPDAEPHIQMLAKKIRKRLDRTDEIQTLQPGEWHLPFASDKASKLAVTAALREGHHPDFVPHKSQQIESLKKLSTARCASVSYKTVDGFDMTLERAIALHDKLVSSKPIHASPAEHVAQADDFLGVIKEWAHPHQHGNFIGFRQYRHQIEQLTR